MRKHQLRRLLLAASALLAAPLASFAQPAQAVRRIAILNQGDRTLREDGWRIFEARLRELGYSEGKNLVIDRRWADGIDDRLPRLAEDLLAGRPEVVLVVSTPATRALMRLTDTIPIVMVASADPVATGLVASLARPGGNVTGVSSMLGAIAVKRLDLLREVVPTGKRFGLLGPAANAGVQAVLKQLQEAARPLGLDVRLLDAHDAPAIARAFERLRAEPGPLDGLLVASVLYAHHLQIVQLAARFGIPAAFVEKDILDAGGLIVLGPDRDAPYRHAAQYAHRILQGAKPADLPVMQPTEFWLGVNLRTARALGLRIPQSVLIRADRVIE
jgi:putative tryptophan/tyrosine transport system substrate-binding protein